MKPTESNLAEARKLIAWMKERIEQGDIVSAKALDLKRALDEAKTEQDISRWLKANPSVIGKLVNARYPHVFDNMRVGTRIPDFVVLDSFSGGWDVTFVELEPPNESLFTKAGVPAFRLAGAIKQCDDWRSYIGKHSDEVQRRLSEKYMAGDPIYPGKKDAPKDCRGIPLTDPQSTICWHFLIVIGRRDKLTPDQIARKADYRGNHRIEIATYDRLVTILDRMECLPMYYY